MSEPIIQAKNIGKKYTLGETTSFDTLRDKVSAFFSEKTPQNISEFWALKDITFNIPRGASIGIIGRNGAGKSTLLKILSRITPPTTGEIIMRGSVASLLEVGTGFHSELSGRENIFLNGCILGMSRAEINRKFDQIVDFAEVQGFLDTPVKRYSSGMIVRLAFSIAAHLDPEIMIVDEVLAVGDMQFQKKCLQKMEEVEKKSGKTIFFVSHDTRMVRSLCSHTMLLKNGKLVLFDETPKVISQYLHDKELSSSPEVEINEEHYDQKSKKIIFHKISLFNSKNESTTKIHFYEIIFSSNGIHRF
jgi:lipopolysaccharide transport system ATP-binding protein